MNRRNSGAGGRQPVWGSLSWDRLSTIVLLLIVGGLCSAAAAAPSVVAYSFQKPPLGGIALVAVDDATGKILAQKVLYTSDTCSQPNKLRNVAGGRLLVLGNEAKDEPHLHLVRKSDGASRTVELPDVPDEMRVDGTNLLATCDGDWLVLVDLKNATVTKQWNAEDILTPPGNAPQDIQIVTKQQQDYAVVSFQKDSKKGTKFGSRLAVFTFPDMQKVADLPLPRNHEELHITGNNQLQGPGPEVVLVAKTSDRMLATLDLYGAVMIADWSAARQGRLANMQVLSTSLDEKFGTAFPDRLVEMYFLDHPYALVCNAGVDGGAVVVSLNDREIKWRREVPPGLEHPVFFRDLYKAYSVCSGKTKYVQQDDVVKEYRPQSGIFVFDFSSTEAVNHAPVRRVAENELAMHRITAVPASRPLLLIAAGAESPDQLIVFDPASEQILDQQPAEGVVMQFAGD